MPEKEYDGWVLVCRSVRKKNKEKKIWSVILQRNEKKTVVLGRTQPNSCRPYIRWRLYKMTPTTKNHEKSQIILDNYQLFSNRYGFLKWPRKKSMQVNTKSVAFQKSS